MPEIVERYVGQANTLKDRLEMLAGDVPGVEGRAVAGRKHKAVISPFSASPKLLFLYLPLAMASEGFYGLLRQVYGPPLPCFGSENTIAILRYRLYEIDLVINRTLVYGPLTAMLVALYFGAVVLLQRLFVALTGEKSTLAVVVSTLLIAAVFTPLRRRIQSFIDVASTEKSTTQQRLWRPSRPSSGTR